MEAYRTDDLEILTNTDSVQVVRHKKLGIWQMVFYREATFKHKQISVTVDRGCALLLKRQIGLSRSFILQILLKHNL